MTEMEYRLLRRALERRGARVTYAVYEPKEASQIYVCVENDTDRRAIEAAYRAWTTEAMRELGLSGYVHFMEWNPTQRGGEISFEIWIMPV